MAPINPTSRPQAQPPKSNAALPSDQALEAPEPRSWLKGTNQQAINHYLTKGTSWVAAAAKARKDGVDLNAAATHRAAPVTVSGTAPPATAAPAPPRENSSQSTVALKQGDHGPRVADYQRGLAGLGFEVTPDEAYGKQTSAATRDYLATQGVQSDGRVVSADVVERVVSGNADRAALGTAVTALTDELLMTDPETLRAMRAVTTQIRHLPDEQKAEALQKALPEHLARLDQLAASGKLSPASSPYIAEVKKQVDASLKDGTITEKAREIDALYKTAVGYSLDRSIDAFTTDLGHKNPALLKSIADQLNKLASIDDHKSGLDQIEKALHDLDSTVAAQPMSPEGSHGWALLRTRFEGSIRADRLSPNAQSSSVANLASFADKAFDKAVETMLDQQGTGAVLDSKRKLPESKTAYMALSKAIHDKLGLDHNSTSLTPYQVDQAFELVGKEFGIRPEFLKYMAKTESSLKQTADNGAACGIMQIERVHKDAYSGPTNVKNDTITNIVYGGLLRAQTDRTMALRFEQAGLTPPNHPRVIEFLGDLAYNRGPGLLKYVAQFAAQQKIDVNKFSEYVAGRGGSFKILDNGRHVVAYPKDDPRIDKTGKNSVLALASEAVGRVKFSAKLQKSLGDRNGDGRVDHLDVWLTRGVRYLKETS